MTTQRIRAVAVTIAMVLGAGTLSAVAAPLAEREPAAVEVAATEIPQPSEEPTEAPPTEAAPDEDPQTDRPKPRAKKDAGKAGPREGRPRDDKPPKSHGAKRGNGHGEAVSAAARGLTPPVGDCRNHGHWVSTVAQGKASCDDNPRPARGGSED